MPERPPRVLLLSADVGASHGAMARALQAALHRADPRVQTVLRNDFAVLGPLLEPVLGRGFRFHLTRAPWAYGATYRLFESSGRACRAGEAALERLGGGALLRVVAEQRPDVVVSTYPIINAVLGRLRAAGRLTVPACGVVGPLAGLRFWSHPGLDAHLAMYEQAVPAIERLAGPGAARAIRPLVDERFYAPRTRAQARAALGLPDGEAIVLVSGGGWGAGDLHDAVRGALDAGPDRVIVLAGRDASARAALGRRLRDDPRAAILPFSDRMDDLLAAADAFVTATGGTSCIEARLRGCPTVCFGFLVGHVRDNAGAQARHGLIDLARSRPALTAAVARALAGGRRPVPPLHRLPSAADLTLELAYGSMRHEAASSPRAPGARTGASAATPSASAPPASRSTT